MKTLACSLANYNGKPKWRLLRHVAMEPENGDLSKKHFYSLNQEEILDVFKSKEEYIIDS